VSEEVLEKAKAGLYSQFEVQRGLPIQLMVKYFQQIGSLWQIDSSIRSMVNYKHFNLLDDYTALGTFDIIFCRNVLIYFDPPTKSGMLARMAKRLRPDGYLVLGAAETVIGISDEFKPVTDARGLYEMQVAAATAAAPATPVSTFSSSTRATPAVAGLGATTVKPATPAVSGLGATTVKPATPAVSGLGATTVSPATPAVSSLGATAAKLATPAVSSLGATMAKLATPAASSLGTTAATPATPATSGLGAALGAGAVKLA
jgi:chemotaxis protein methyltransferase CheR